MGVPYQQVRICRGRELREKRGQVELTDLAGSTRARRERRKRRMTRLPVGHGPIIWRRKALSGQLSAASVRRDPKRRPVDSARKPPDRFLDEDAGTGG
jgi:hypothetical protein